MPLKLLVPPAWQGQGCGEILKFPEDVRKRLSVCIHSPFFHFLASRKVCDDWSSRKYFAELRRFLCAIIMYHMFVHSLSLSRSVC